MMIETAQLLMSVKRSVRRATTRDKLCAASRERTSNPTIHDEVCRYCTSMTHPTAKILEVMHGDHAGITALASAFASNDIETVSAILAERGLVLASSEISGLMSNGAGAATNTNTCTFTMT